MAVDRRNEPYLSIPLSTFVDPDISALGWDPSKSRLWRSSVVPPRLNFLQSVDNVIGIRFQVPWNYTYSDFQYCSFTLCHDGVDVATASVGNRFVTTGSNFQNMEFTQFFSSPLTVDSVLPFFNNSSGSSGTVSGPIYIHLLFPPPPPGLSPFWKWRLLNDK